jgi:hypothetical protein
MSTHRQRGIPRDRVTSPVPENNDRTAAAPNSRTKRSVQVQALKAAALVLAKHRGTTIEVSGYSVLEIKFDPLLIWITPFGPWTNLDIWDETQRGKKVLNLAWFPNGAIDIASFRRGAWEEFLLSSARRHMH